MSVTITAPVVPTFTQLGPYCQNDIPGVLVSPSTNGITGTWSPATISTATVGTQTYTFTPALGQCATTATMDVTITSPIVPTFTQLGPYCQNDTPGVLVSPSTNGITGTWSPATISTATVGTQTYTFTPTAGQCATTAIMNVTVTGTLPTFTQLGPYCQNDTPGVLVSPSTNGITGTWSPATISTATVGTQTYTFTPTAGQCATTATMDVTITSPIVPTFTQLGPYCQNDIPGVLVSPSTNGITGTWSPSTISTATVGTQTYTFTPTAGQCATTATMSVTITAPVVPTFTQLGPYCQNDIPGVLVSPSTNGITGTWSPATISTATVGTQTYTFTPTAGQCATTATMNITILPLPNAGTNGVLPICNNPIPQDLFLSLGGTPQLGGIWTPILNSGTGFFDPAIDASGVYTYTIISPCSTVSATVTVFICPTIDIVVPDGFSPNGDGINDEFVVRNLSNLYPNYTLEIYNRYGSVLYKGNINTPNWNGKSTEALTIGDGLLPTGVYFFIIEFNDGNRKPLQGRVYLSR
jgi:gliding motility-associated-like protein